MADESWDWVWNPERKKWMIEAADGRRYEIVWVKGNKQFPFKVLCDGQTALGAENNGYARTMWDAKRIAIEAAEGRARRGMENPEFVRARRRHQRRVHKPLY